MGVISVMLRATLTEVRIRRLTFTVDAAENEILDVNYEDYH